MKLKECPFCGSGVMLCKQDSMFGIWDFSIICTKCNIEIRKRYNPQQNCCFDMNTAINSIVNTYNRRAGDGDGET